MPDVPRARGVAAPACLAPPRRGRGADLSALDQVDPRRQHEQGRHRHRHPSPATPSKQTFRRLTSLCAGGGEVHPIGLSFNLDDEHSVAREPRRGRPYFGTGTVVTLTDNEIQSFAVYVHTRRYYVEFELVKSRDVV